MVHYLVSCYFTDIYLESSILFKSLGKADVQIKHPVLEIHNCYLANVSLDAKTS